MKASHLDSDYDHPEPKPERPPFVARPLKLSEPENECTSFAEYQEATAKNTRIRQQHEADETARFRQYAADNATALKNREAKAVEYRRQLLIVCARQVETLALYRADHTKILDRIHREGNTVGDASASGVGLPSNSGPANFDDMPMPPIAVFVEVNSGSGEELPSGITRVGPPGKGKMKAAALGVTPGAMLSARPELSSSGPAMAGGSSRTVSGAANVGKNPEVGPSQVREESPYDPEAWHAAHNPFNKHPFQTEVALNTNGTKVVVSHGWRVNPVNPHFLARLALYGIIGTQVPTLVVITRATRCHVKNHTCVTFKGRFDFTLTDHVISVINAELLDMYTNGLLAVFSSFTGIDVVSRIIACLMVFHQDALLEGPRTSRTDAPVTEEPIERHIDVPLREGRGRESYIEQSLVPFRGAQFRDHEHQLLLLATQDPNNATMFLTHMVEDIVDRISAGAREMGGSFNQRVTQAFHPEQWVRLPENFEVGDRLLIRNGSIAAAAAHVPPLRPPILPADGELLGFSPSYHFSGNARAQLEEQFPGGAAVQHHIRPD
ncbi:hypothetical protein B0H14DRAFT_2616756 [Mycena olivaceomarginata]|nr:hypothetical protein B0H14DRAFT_2616756 [Mycena olivaceomarginata]